MVRGDFMLYIHNVYNLPSMVFDFDNKTNIRGKCTQNCFVNKDLLLQQIYHFYCTSDLGEFTLKNIENLCLIVVPNLSKKIVGALISLLKQGFIYDTGKKIKQYKVYCITERGIYHVTHQKNERNIRV